jgi:hypothetical protein
MSSSILPSDEVRDHEQERRSELDQLASDLCDVAWKHCLEHIVATIVCADAKRRCG